MKLAIIISLLALCVCACRQEKRSEITKPPTPTLEQTLFRPKEFYFMDMVSISNAVHFLAPPKGWSVVCDDAGHFAVKDGKRLLNYDADLLRTSRIEAVVCAWRVKGITDNPPSSSFSKAFSKAWKECDQ